MMNFYTYTLSNGIRLIHHPVNGEVAHCGLMIHAGSRNEKTGEHGMAHFIEHMLFKGTQRRKAYHILSRMDDSGGELNAYTTKEETCIYASFLNKDYERAIELIQDIVFHSVFPEKEMEREKEVIIDEILSYKDNPAELIFDEFEEMIFRDQSIGKNILGTPESLGGFSQKDIHAFMEENYHTDEMVLSSVGNIPFAKLVRLFEKYFSPVEPRPGKRIPASRPGYTSDTREVKNDTYQAHCILGGAAYGMKDEKRFGLYLLNSILGGQGLNSRLNLSLREKNGYAYNVESNYQPYTDTGVLSIYFGTDKKDLQKSLKITHRELDRLLNIPVGTFQLRKAKKQLTGQMARGLEIHENLMQSMAKKLLVYGKVDPPEIVMQKIEEIKAEELSEIASEIFKPDQLSRLVYM